MKNVSLSFQDLFLLAFEREDLPFVSSFYFETSHPIGFEKYETYKDTFVKYISLEPQLQITCHSNSGHFTHIKFSNDEIKQSCYFFNTEEEESHFLENGFKSHQLPVRMACYKNKLIFLFHHPLFDGHAQINFLKDYFDIYHGKDFKPRGINSLVQLRSYFFKASLFWYLKLIFNQIIKKNSQSSRVKISRLADFEPKTRKMAYELLEFNRKKIDSASRKLKMSSTCFFSMCALKAFHTIQCKRGETDRAIVVYIPKSLRSELKNMRAFQNLIGFIWMKISRDKITSPQFQTFFREFYKFRSSDNELRKVLFWAGLLTKLCSYKKLKKALEHKERKIHDCSLLISSGRTPSEVLIPEELKEAKFYARGSMHRSPGIALLATSNYSQDFLTIEYLVDSFNRETILEFKNTLAAEINSYISDP